MLAVLTGSIGWVLLLRPFYYVQIDPLGVCQASGLTAEQVLLLKVDAAGTVYLVRKEDMA